MLKVLMRQFKWWCLAAVPLHLVYSLFRYLFFALVVVACCSLSPRCRQYTTYEKEQPISATHIMYSESAPTNDNNWITIYTHFHLAVSTRWRSSARLHLPDTECCCCCILYIYTFVCLLYLVIVELDAISCWQSFLLWLVAMAIGKALCASELQHNQHSYSK